MKVSIARFCSILTIGFLLVPSGAGRGRWPVLGRPASGPWPVALNLAPYSQGSTAPTITSLQLFLDDKLVSQLIIGTKAKRYSLKIIGQGFDPAAKLVVDGMRARVSMASSVELDARLKGGPLMFPGEAAVHVVNPDGETSNAVLLEVVTDPSILSIASINPDFGPLGAQITVTGLGFAAKGNHIRLLSPATGVVGVTTEVTSQDGRTLAFSLPDFICPPCSLSVPPCAAPCFALKPGDYDLFVINDKGMSNALKLLVSSSTGPIGMWGEQNLSVEVTDTQVTISGTCFSGQIPQTLTTDAMGNFKLAGTITTFIGPGNIARPATYQGTISGNMMTLSITGDLLNLGPFTLTFGVEVHIVPPCV
jgi:hypothetical protein